MLPGVIAYHLPSIQDKLAAAGSSAIDFAYPALVSAVVPKPVMGFFAAVLFGAILSSFNSVLNSASTMFTLDLYRTAINPKASDMQCVKVGKIYGTCAGAVAICVAPFVMFAQGITTFPQLYEPVRFPTDSVHRTRRTHLPQGTEVRTQGHHRCSRYRLRRVYDPQALLPHLG